MLDSFALQLSMWLAAAAASTWVIVYFRGKQQEITKWDDLRPERDAAEQLLAQVQQMRTELGRLEPQVADAQAAVASAERARADEVAARQWLTQQKDELLRVEAQRQEQERLKESLAAIQAQMSVVEADRRNLLEANGRLLDENRGIEGRLAEAKRRIEEADAALTKGKADLDDLAKRVQATVGELRRSEEDLVATKATAARQLADLQRRHEEEMRRLGRELEDRIAAVERVTKELKELESKRNEASTAIRLIEMELIESRAQVERLQAERKNLQEHLAMLRKMIEDADRRLDQAHERAGTSKAEERYRDLWEPLPFPSLAPTTGIIREADSLARVEQHLKGVGLHFPQRVVYAFHTALKVAEYSPMVVLAGISGTGKSELPRRYADAMGLHFVGIAVQPRWDSPQDLFGFFNYMEGRYKATELARAMVQFERFNRDRWLLPKDWSGARDDRMLLVLLDEMNLARVEYYFSEFLSKLEVRRGIREDDAMDRAKAEIAIDMGSLGKDEHPITFYPARNVLFAGTMNEDETTQSLSDKVLDRACVLRFGRPKQASQARGSGDGIQAKYGLTFESWKSWQRGELANSDAKQVSDWIAALNEAMERIGRPFGHRVAQAMHAYVANYPESGMRSADRVRTAFADQIEQRILPKLRGLELDEHRVPMASIRKVLQDCDDRELLSAFDEGEKNKQIFIWRGLDRSA